MTNRPDLDDTLRARLSIEAFNADYVNCIDEDRLEDWPGFFTETGRYRVTTRENVELGLPLSLIACEGRGMLKDRITAMRTANIFEPHVYCHMVGSLKIIAPADHGAGSSAWRTVSNFSVFRTMTDGAMTVFACGRYIDRLVESADGLLLADRTVVLDSRRIDTLLVIPL